MPARRRPVKNEGGIGSWTRQLSVRARDMICVGEVLTCWAAQGLHQMESWLRLSDRPVFSKNLHSIIKPGEDRRRQPDYHALFEPLGTRYFESDSSLSKTASRNSVVEWTIARRADLGDTVK